MKWVKRYLDVEKVCTSSDKMIVRLFKTNPSVSLRSGPRYATHWCSHKNYQARKMKFNLQQTTSEKQWSKKLVWMEENLLFLLSNHWFFLGMVTKACFTKYTVVALEHSKTPFKSTCFWGCLRKDSLGCLYPFTDNLYAQKIYMEYLAMCVRINFRCCRNLDATRGQKPKISQPRLLLLGNKKTASL